MCKNKMKNVNKKKTEEKRQTYIILQLVHTIWVQRNGTTKNTYNMVFIAKCHDKKTKKTANNEQQKIINMFMCSLFCCISYGCYWNKKWYVPGTKENVCFDRELPSSSLLSSLFCVRLSFFSFREMKESKKKRESK